MPAVRDHSLTSVRAVLAIALMGTIASLPSLLAPVPTRAAEHAVQIADSAFSPATLTISVGDTVSWTNVDDRPHTVTSNDGGFDSGNIDEGQAFSFTFTEPGTYTYRCNYHPDMQATIVVGAASAQEPASGGQTSGGTDAPASNGTGAPAPGGNDAAAPTTHTPATHEGGQPDTAIPAPISLAWLAPVLIGLGLVALAFGLIPPAAPLVDPTPSAGWRR